MTKVSYNNLSSELRNIICQNYILPSIQNRFKYEYPARKIQRWWKRQIKGYFRINISAYFDVDYNGTYYAYDGYKNIFLVRPRNKCSNIYTPILKEENICSTWINIYKDFIEKEKEKFRILDNIEDVCEDYFELIKYIEIHIWFGITFDVYTVNDDEEPIDYDFYFNNSEKLIDKVKMPNYDTIFVEKFNQVFLDKCKKYKII